MVQYSYYGTAAGFQAADIAALVKQELVKNRSFSVTGQLHR